MVTGKLGKETLKEIAWKSAKQYSKEIIWILGKNLLKRVTWLLTKEPQQKISRVLVIWRRTQKLLGRKDNCTAQTMSTEYAHAILPFYRPKH